MRKTNVLKIITISVIILFGIMVTETVRAEDELETITFNDENMYNAVVEALGDKVVEKNNKSIKMTQTNINEVTSLELEKKEISDITGIEKFTKLESLKLSSNKISDITAIENLTNLKLLWLPDNQIDKIDSLKKLSNLESLSLGKNNFRSEGYKVLSDMNNNGNFNNLRSLWLWELGITDLNQIDFLKNLKDLTLLDLHGNSISDISDLKELTNLRALYLGIASNGNKIKDIDALSELTNLNELCIDSNGIEDISPLKKLTNLTRLQLSYNQINDISVLKNFKNLKLLSLSNNDLDDSDFIILSQITDNDNFSNLETLSMENLNINKFEQIDFIKKLTKLKNLNLSKNHIQDFSKIIELNNIENKYISGQTITLTSGSKEIELPLIIKQSFEIYKATDLNLTNCTVNNEYTQATIIDLKQDATIVINDGNLKNSVITIKYAGELENATDKKDAIDKENQTVQENNNDEHTADRVLPNTGDKMILIFLMIFIIVAVIAYKNFRKSEWKN